VVKSYIWSPYPGYYTRPRNIGNMKTSDHLWLTNAITQILSVVTWANTHNLFPGTERDKKKKRMGTERAEA